MAKKQEPTRAEQLIIPLDITDPRRWPNIRPTTLSVGPKFQSPDDQFPKLASYTGIPVFRPQKPPDLRLARPETNHGELLGGVAEDCTLPCLRFEIFVRWMIGFASQVSHVTDESDGVFEKEFLLQVRLRRRRKKRIVEGDMQAELCGLEDYCASFHNQPQD